MTSRSPRRWICDSSAQSSIVYIRLVWFLVRDFVPLFRSFLYWFQSIQTRRCHCLCLKDVWCFKPLLTPQRKGPFSGCLILNNILWMAPNHQAVYLGDNYTFSLSLLNTCTVQKSPYLYLRLRRRINVVVIVIYYPTILSFYHIMSRECAKHGAVIIILFKNISVWFG